MIKRILQIEQNCQGLRLDQCLALHFPEYSRSFFQNLVRENCITVDKKQSKSNQRLKFGQEVEISFPSPKSVEILPQEIDLDIVYEDQDIAVINKPQGMVVHPAPGNSTNTLVNALLAKLENLSGINGQIRPGIVHRLDKDTSGLLIIAKNDLSHIAMAEQIRNREVKRIYNAITHKVFKHNHGKIDEPIGRHPTHRKKMAISKLTGSRQAISHYKVLERFRGYTYVEVSLETGRTHQIRVHLSGIGYPIVGDPVYTSLKNPFGIQKQLLHARKLIFKHPSTGEIMEFQTELPKDFKEVLSILQKEYCDNG